MPQQATGSTSALFVGEKNGLVFEEVIVIFTDSQWSHGQLSCIEWERIWQMLLLLLLLLLLVSVQVFLPNSLTYQNKQHNEAKARRTSKSTSLP